MVRHQRVHRAIGQARAQCVAVTLLAQRRIQPGAAVEMADVQIGQVQGVDADVAAHFQAVALGLAHQFDAGGAAQAAQVNLGICGSQQLKYSV